MFSREHTPPLPSARVREAGCIFLGKIAMPDFGTLGLGIPSLHGSQCAYEDTLKVLRLVDPAGPGDRAYCRQIMDLAKMDVLFPATAAAHAGAAWPSAGNVRRLMTIGRVTA